MSKEPNRYAKNEKLIGEINGKLMEFFKKEEITPTEAAFILMNFVLLMAYNDGILPEVIEEKLTKAAYSYRLYFNSKEEEC